jgi:NADH-quinone oxidoreductase subunit L
MPITYWTFLIGAAANAGIFPLAGFWSKDEIIVGSWATGYPIIAAVGLLAAFFTSLYMFRVVFMTFHGKPRFDQHHIHPHESPWSMAAPLVLLAIPAALLGFIGFPPEHGWFHQFIEPVFSHGTEVAGHEVSMTTTLILGAVSTAIALGGLWVAAAAYITGSINPRRFARQFEPAYKLFYNKWFFDEIYEAVIVHPLYLFSVFLWRVVDVKLIDGTVNGVAKLLAFSSQRARLVQTGLVANYALAIALGGVVIVGVYLVTGSNLFQ